jgi:transposase, IS5 family
MIRYTSQHQLSISEFKTPFEQSLLPTNRWVLLSSALPWDDLAQVYHRQMSIGMGRGSVNTRLVIGVLIIKHILSLPQREQY